MRSVETEVAAYGVRLPTYDECNGHAPVGKGFACWYPQMGGYSGRAVVCRDEESDCVEVFVWHDGEFPFDDSERGPVWLHHCDIAQFIAFGETVSRLLGL